VKLPVRDGSTEEVAVCIGVSDGFTDGLIENKAVELPVGDGSIEEVGVCIGDSDSKEDAVSEADAYELEDTLELDETLCEPDGVKSPERDGAALMEGNKVPDTDTLELTEADPVKLD
jgi:hypothetical protein